MDASRYGKDWDPTEHYQDCAVACAYDRERFTSLAGRLFNHRDREAVRRAFADLPPDSLIGDIPCGTGRMAEVALELGHRVHGIDISPAMIEVARHRLARFGTRFTAQAADVRALDAAHLQFDAVLSARFLMHFPVAEQVALVQSMARAARHRVVLTQGLISPWHRLRRAVKQRAGVFQNPAAFPLTRAELATMLREADLCELRRYHLLPLVSEAVVIVAQPMVAGAGR
jgi:2-polyprenyl-3-methyl-5-hydroxy-6-metoxy-1,4-benzoquinol methylase